MASVTTFLTKKWWNGGSPSSCTNAMFENVKNAWNMYNVQKDTEMTYMSGLLGLNNWSSIDTKAQMDDSCGDLHGFSMHLPMNDAI
jgi:hypothetical protein